MTAPEIASFVVSRWLLDHSPEGIMVGLICLGQPMRKADVLAIIRRYVDEQSENRGYRGKV
jgi:hypothetical protein